MKKMKKRLAVLALALMSCFAMIACSDEGKELEDMKLDKYMELGFNNFKIEGRVLMGANVLESYVYYMVKPEHRDRIRLELHTAERRPSIIAQSRRTALQKRMGK